MFFPLASYATLSLIYSFRQSTFSRNAERVLEYPFRILLRNKGYSRTHLAFLNVKFSRHAFQPRSFFMWNTTENIFFKHLLFFVSHFLKDFFKSQKCFFLPIREDILKPQKQFPFKNWQLFLKYISIEYSIQRII